MSLIIYEGPSLIDPTRSVAVIATFDSRNKKTGGMAQIWILDQAERPSQAQKTGADRSVCGDCVMRPINGGYCYVLTFQAPDKIWDAYKRGLYKKATQSDIDFSFYRRKVRFGAYGDPAAVAASVYDPIRAVCNSEESTAYTHQHGRAWYDSGFNSWAVISADTIKQAKRHHAAGRQTFRAIAPGEELLPGEVMCDNVETNLQCIDCGRCNGKRESVAVPFHGSRAKSAGLISLATVN